MYDYGFTTHSEDEIKPPTNTKAERVYEMVKPLIDGLLEDADSKEYIKWPNRRKTLEKLKKDIEKILKE